MADMHTQCRLRRESDNLEHVAWIPAKHARKGKVVTLKTYEGGPWEVMEVWGSRPTDDVMAHERDYLKQRAASDI